MKFISLCSGCGGIDLGLERSGFKCLGQVEIMEYALKVLKKNWPEVPKHTDILTLLLSDSPAKTYLKQTAKERGLKAVEALSSLSVCELSTSLSRLGYSLKMFPNSFPLITEGIWPSSFKRWPKAAMGGLIDYWTVNTSESPNDAKECSLLDVLEDCVPQKFYLSRKAVEGMIRRSKKWGRGGYVFLLETGKDKTRRLRRLSLQELEQLLSEPKKQATESADLSHKHLGQPKEEILALYGKTLMLRKLTPTEKEKLQGFPINFTLAEE